MRNGTCSLRPVEKVEVLVAVDNYSDLMLTGNGPVRRPPLAPGGIIPGDTLRAEHGLSLLVTTFDGGKRHSILFDTGYGPDTAPKNLSLLGENLYTIESLVISHGHPDHTGAVGTILREIHRDIDVVVHPDAFLNRVINRPNGERIGYGRIMKLEDLERDGGKPIFSRRPYLLAGNTVLATGEIPRTVLFEKGIAGALIDRDGRLEPDSFLDDLGLVIRLRDRGLIVLSGCAHAGIINTVLCSREITGVEEIHAVMGGFHLGGANADELIRATAQQMKRFSPAILMPMHCTGWKAVVEFYREFPSAFILSSVGTKIVL